MSAQLEVVEAQPRPDSSRGKNEARRLRVSGRVPAVVYGAKKNTVAVSLDPKVISRILASASGHNTIFDLQVGSEKTKAMIVDWQFEPIRGSILHIDLKRIAMDEKMRVMVPIHLVGEAVGVKQQGGIMDQILREVEIECLPGDIPSHIDADVSTLEFGVVLRVKDLPHGGKLKFITPEDQGVAHVTAVKEEVAATPEATAEAAAAGPAEPEVIKKGKQETEEGEAEKAPPAKK
ncbi:MAG: 50S ribosomal protein L25 [Candidatus Angelobacter sp.]